MKRSGVVCALRKSNQILRAKVSALAKQNIELHKALDSFLLEQAKNRSSWYSVTYKPLEEK